jgi:hypothetical protein
MLLFQRLFAWLSKAPRLRVTRQVFDSPVPPLRRRSFNIDTMDQQAARPLAAESPRLFCAHHRHPAVFYRGIETPASFSSRFLYRRAPAQAAREIRPEFRSCEAPFDDTPHPARYARHPLPKRDGRWPRLFSALSRGARIGTQPSPLGRGWPAAGAFTSRSGPGEGSLLNQPNTNSVLRLVNAGSSDSTNTPG